MDSSSPPEPPAADDPRPVDGDRATRLASRRSWRRRAGIGVVVVALVAGGAVAVYAVSRSNDGSVSSAATAGTEARVTTTTRARPTTTTAPRPTTTTVPRVHQPKWGEMPSPGAGLRYGDRGPLVLAYEMRMKALHLDPGPVDGVFDQDTQYAVTTVQKYFNMPRTGVIDGGVQYALGHFVYVPAVPDGDADRVEIDLDRQVLTLYQGNQVTLMTTTSTGSGEYFCGGVDGCQYAITPTGHFHFYELHKGWQKGKLGTMWNPYYFNGSDAVHGLQSVPAYPASHGCARIPMHIADYFYTLVHDGMSVYVVGTPKQRGSQYVGPVRTPPPAATTTVPTTAPAATTPTTKHATPATTVPKSTTPTTKPKKP